MDNVQPNEHSSDGWRPHIALSSPDDGIRSHSSLDYSFDGDRDTLGNSLDFRELDQMVGSKRRITNNTGEAGLRYLRSKQSRSTGKTRTKLLFFSLAWILLLFITPMWLYGVNSIEIYAYNVTKSLNEINIQKLPGKLECESCNSSEDPRSLTFPITFTASLTSRPPTRAPAPVLFATNKFTSDWWVVGVSKDFITSLNQTWTIPGKYCFGAAGHIYLVACLPRDGFEPVIYEKIKPPFDDKCFALGSRCGVSCHGIAEFPHYCVRDVDSHFIPDSFNGIIPITNLVNSKYVNCVMDPLSNVTNNCTNIPASFLTGKGIWAFVFYFFSFFSLINYLINHSSPVFGWIDQLTPELEPEYLPVKKDRAIVGVASIFCSEKVFHMIRNIFGVTGSWLQLEKELDRIRFSQNENIHYILDNSMPLGKDDGDKAYRSYLPHFIELLLPLIGQLSADKIEKISFALRAAPFQCTEEEYEEFLPFEMRELVDKFIRSVPKYCRAPYTPVDSTRFKEMPYQIDDELNNHIDLNIAKHKCCDGKCEYSKSVFSLVLDHERKIVVKFVVLSATTGNAKGKSVSLQHVANVMRNDNVRKKATSFLALMDARHMMTPLFWSHTIVHFFNSLGYEITTLRWIQVMQYFTGLENTNDYFDRGNFFNYLYNNALRDKIKSTTSCGTNALWSMREHRLRHGDDYEFIPFQFKGKTKIEDTETSHQCLRFSEDSIYVAKPLVYGSVKDPVEYGEAPSRWAAVLICLGAMQLFIVEIKKSPWILFWSIFLYLILPAGYAFIVYFVNNGQYILLAIDMFLLLALLCITMSKTGKAIGRYLIRVVNVTYWMTGPISAVFWMDLMPCLLLVSPTIPFRLNTQLMVLGGIVFAALQWVITSITKSWAKTKEVHLWRSQQAWYALWPLVIAGIPSLFSSNKTWSVSSSQALFTLIFNCIQMLCLAAACVYGVYSLSAIISVSNQNQVIVSDEKDNVMGQRIVGLVLAIFSFLLIYPITISLLMSQFGSKTTSILDVSMRHFTLLFMILLVVVIYAFNFDSWRWEAFTSYATIGWPTLDLSRWFG